jgi:hypothetical protein
MKNRGEEHYEHGSLYISNFRDLTFAKEISRSRATGYRVEGPPQ